MGHSNEVVSVGDFHIQPFHEYTMNTGNPVKYQISDITAPTKKDPASTGPTATEDISSS